MLSFILLLLGYWVLFKHSRCWVGFWSFAGSADGSGFAFSISTIILLNLRVAVTNRLISSFFVRTGETDNGLFLRP